MMKQRATATVLSSMRGASIYLLLLATVSGCTDSSGPPPGVDPVRPVKTLLVSASAGNTGIRFPGRVRTTAPIELAFEGEGGTIIELPIAGREGQVIQQGELLAQIDPKGFETALSSAENELTAAYPVLDLARTENERMQEMKGINPDLVSDTMLARTRENLRLAQSRLESLEAKVAKAEHLLANTSLRAPFTGIIVRCLAKNAQVVEADEPIARLQDTTHLEVVVDATGPMMSRARAQGPDEIFATVQFDAVPNKVFPLRLKEEESTPDPTTKIGHLVLEMTKPAEIDLPPGTAGTVTVGGQEAGMAAGTVLVPAIAVLGDPDGRSYVWLVSAPQLRAQRRDVRIGRLAGSDQIQILSGLQGGERIVVAGVTQLTEGRQVRLWEDADASRNQ